MNYFLGAYFIAGLFFASMYGTWLIAIGVGGTCLLAYYSVKLALPDSDLYQYVLSAVLAIFMAQYIYQLHGLFEMHFFAFIGSAILVTYQNWKLQLPALIVVFIHHALFSYLHDLGLHGVYFTQLDYFDLQTFIIHILLTMTIFLICGLWSYQLNKYHEMQISQALKMADLNREAQLSSERQRNSEVLTRMNETLQKQAGELKISNAELEQFTYTVSHDLQEPLRMVTGFLGLLEKKHGRGIDEKGKEYIRFAVNACEQMRQLILDLLEFSRAGRGEEKAAMVELNQLLGSILSLYEGQIAEGKIVLWIPELPSLQVPPGPVRQVFLNLIGNAIKYQPLGQVPVIKISAKAIPGFWEFGVSDNGIGIQPEFKEQVFMLFKRLHSRETYPGTGLGLAITKKIVETLGGTISLSSKSGSGTTFYFTIPHLPK